MVTWPSTLQALLNESNFNMEFGAVTIISDMETGPPKRRNRFTKGIDRFSTQIWIKKSDYPTFELFFKTSLNHGINSFGYNHPISGVPTEFKIVGTPRVSTVGGENFSIDMTWEAVP